MGGVPVASNDVNYNDLCGKVWSLSKTAPSKTKGSDGCVEFLNEGCVKVQNVFKDPSVHKDIKSALVSELKNHVGAAWKHEWANYVLQCALEFLPQPATEFIVDEMLQHVSQAAKHQRGVRVVQKILEFGAPEKAKFFVEPLFAIAHSLCKGQYGIYAVEHLMEHAP